MPRHRSHSGKVHGGHREVDQDADNNNQNGHDDGDRNGQPAARLPVKCCVPAGCENDEINIDPKNPGTSVRVSCNNVACNQGNWMHKDCFASWEENVLGYLRSCGRARSWSEKQRFQNLWTKKGYDLAFKACDCKCGRGHMRKDLDYFPKVVFTPAEPAKKKKHHKKNDKPLPVMNRGPPPQHSVVGVAAGNNNGKAGIRDRTASTSSTGSSPPASASPTNIPAGSGGERSDSASPPAPSTPPINVNATLRGLSSPQKNTVATSQPKYSDVTDQLSLLPTVTGNIFKHRSDFTAFNSLPKHKRNPYHIKMEDEGLHGNDDARSLILSSLSSYKMTSVSCVLCNRSLNVFDRYPLVDGSFFLSPLPYSSNVQVPWEGRTEYLNAVCMQCLGAREMRCKTCSTRWDGSTMQLGTMYTYDIFAAMPCCQQRLACKHCTRSILDLSLGGFQFYSEYSHSICCPFCKMEDFHFVKPLNQCFYMQQLI